MPKGFVNFCHPPITFNESHTCIPAKACWASFTFLDSNANWRGSRHFSLANTEIRTTCELSKVGSQVIQPYVHPPPKCCTHIYKTITNHENAHVLKKKKRAKKLCRNDSIAATCLLSMVSERANMKTLKTIVLMLSLLNNRTLTSPWTCIALSKTNRTACTQCTWGEQL